VSPPRRDNTIAGPSHRNDLIVIGDGSQRRARGLLHPSNEQGSFRTMASAANQTALKLALPSRCWWAGTRSINFGHGALSVPPRTGRRITPRRLLHQKEKNRIATKLPRENKNECCPLLTSRRELNIDPFSFI
jgi:hypothetical protein